MSLITRQGKGSKLSIQEMDNNLLYLESLSGNTGFTQAKIGTDTDYSLFDPDGSLRFYGSATTFTDAAVDILTEISPTGNPTSAKMFRNDEKISDNYAQEFVSPVYGSFIASGYTTFKNSLTGGTFSVSFWFKSSISSGRRIMFSVPSSGSSTTPIFGIAQIGNKCGVILNNFTVTSTNSINVGSWYHVCYTQTSTQGTLYLNNITTSVPVSAIHSIGQHGFWGCFNNNSVIYNQFLGALSNLRVYRVELTPGQVSDLYNTGTGLPVNSNPTGINEGDHLFNFKNLEPSGSYLINSASIGTGMDIVFSGSPTFINGPINGSSIGVSLPVFESVIPGTIGDQRSIRFEMHHNWKVGTDINLHMHISTDQTIYSGQTIVFILEKTIQDIYAVLSTTSLSVLNSGKTFPVTSAVTYTFTAPQDIPPYTNLILEFSNISMSQYTSVSTCGAMTLTRLSGTFPGDIFEIQSIRMHYEIDSTGSRTRYAK